MSKRSHQEEMLVNIYNLDAKKVQAMSDAQIQKLLEQKEKDHIAIAKNPNKFWYIKGMPAPQHIEPTTTKKAGFLVVVALFLVLVGFLILFVVLAFAAN